MTSSSGYTLGGRRRRIEAEDVMSINYGPARTDAETLVVWEERLARARESATPDADYIGYIERTIATLKGEE